ncbi:MAG: GTP-binding protein, partial [Candidatus Thorarchaeota archaeon]
MIVDYGSKTISLKIVFYGPAMSGKTTAIRWLFSAFDYLEELTSIENTVGRTMFCDYGSISFLLDNNWTIDAHIWSATGQDFYKSTREIVLVGTDGLIFIADSQRHLLDDNIASWDELNTMLDLQDTPLPIVICLNKQDLPNTVHETEFRREIGIPNSVEVLHSIALDGT